MDDERSATRANFPSQYAFSLVSPPPPKTPTASSPWLAWTRRNDAATRSRASSQVAGVSSPSRLISGVSSREPPASRSAEVHPFWHRPPRLVGKSLGPTRTRPSSRVSVMPHCSEQYGQCVRTTRQRCANRVIRSHHERYTREASASPIPPRASAVRRHPAISVPAAG